MVRDYSNLIGERFEPAKALWRGMALLAWRRRFLLFTIGAARLVTVLSLCLLAFTLVFSFAPSLSPHTLIGLLRSLAFGSLFALLSALVVVFRQLVRERFPSIVAEADHALGGEHFRNALDLTKLRNDEPFVSPQFARAAIFQAWQLWENAARNGLLQSLLQPYRQQALLTLAVTLPLTIVSLLFAHRQGFSVRALVALSRDAQAAVAFERFGQLSVRIHDADGVVLKGSVVQVNVHARAPNDYPLPRHLTVWLEWRTPKGVKHLPMRRASENEFVFKLTVLETGVLRAICGKVSSNRLRLRAVSPPRIVEWLVTIDPPAYTNLSSATFSTSEWQPMTVLKGSKVTVLATATETLQRIFIELPSGTVGVKALPLSLRPRFLASPILALDGRAIRWEQVILSPVRVRWRFVDRFGFVGETDWLTISVRPDKPPRVNLLAGTTTVMAGGFVPLTVRAEDDFGVSTVALEFGLGDAKRLPDRVRFVPLTIVPAPQVEQTLALPIPSDAFGKYLWVRAIAKDNDEILGAKTATSAWVSIPIIAPEEFLGNPQEWLARLRQWEAWLQKGEWQKTQQDSARWLQQWREWMQKALWANVPVPNQWMAEWLAHLQEHLQQRDLMKALQELWQMQHALERALAEQRLAKLAQELSALRAQQETVHEALRRHARPSSLLTTQERIAQRAMQLTQALRDEAKRWEKLDEPSIAFALQDVAKVLERRPTLKAMQQAQAAMEQEVREAALLHTHEALTDLREAEERLTSPTQSPLAQLYRQERNLLAQLLEQTERLRRDQAALRRETEASISRRPPSWESKAPSRLTPPLPPEWGEVERLPASPSPLQPTLHSLAQRQEQLQQRGEQMQRPLREALRAVPQLSPDAFHLLQKAVEHMGNAVKSLQQETGKQPSQAAAHQRQAETALGQLAETLQQVLQMEQGSVTQQMGAGENEAMALAQRQAQLLRETRQLHQQRQRGQIPPPMRLRQLGAEEGAIRQALSRMEGFFGDALPNELRQRLGQAQEFLRWLERNLPEGETGQLAQQRQQQVLKTLWELAQVLSGQQGNRQGQQQARQGQTPTQPDLNWGRFVEHGPPMRQVPEALQGVKGGAAFTERSKFVNPSQPPPVSVLRFALPPAYREAVQNYQRQLHR